MPPVLRARRDLAKDAFASLHDYLRVNRNEVVILVLEDHVEPKDAVAVLEASHLADRAYTWVPGTPPPTLREMIRKKKNVLIMAEHHGGVRPWYQAALRSDPAGHALPVHLADRAGGPGLLRARGGARPAAPLLLINHWLDTGLPNPNDAAEANAHRRPRRRVDACERRRKHQPTILAVDFYSRGDLMKEVDRLNGVAMSRLRAGHRRSLTFADVRSITRL